MVLICLAGLKVAAWSLPKRYWLNLTDSEPIGLYRLERTDLRGVRRGDLVIMELPGEFHRYVYGRRWLPRGWSLLKHVGAVSGDLYCITDAALAINGRTVGPVYAADEEGLPLPRLRGCREVPAGHFLPVAVRIKRSFDGRYMGPVSLSAIRGIATPVFTLP